MNLNTRSLGLALLLLLLFLGATVTLQPGVIVKNTGGGSIFIQRAFIAEGRTRPDSMIVFTSYRDDFYGGDTNNDLAATTPAASDWNYVTVDGTAIDPQVRFKNCVFRYGGSGTTQGALRAVNSSPTADSTIFAYNTVGLSVEGASTSSRILSWPSSNEIIPSLTTGPNSVQNVRYFSGRCSLISFRAARMRRTRWRLIT